MYLFYNRSKKGVNDYMGRSWDIAAKFEVCNIMRVSSIFYLLGFWNSKIEILCKYFETNYQSVVNVVIVK